MSFDTDTTESHERRIGRCREPSCRAQVIWLKTAAGKNMPCDADTVEPDDELYVPERHTSHFKTCKTPNRFSGARK